MSKTDVYNWHLDPDLKQRLERAARAKKVSVGSLLDRIARDWLGRRPCEEDDEALQRRLRAEAAKWIGSISSRDPYRSEQIKERVRAKLMAKHKRLQRDAAPRPRRRSPKPSWASIVDHGSISHYLVVHEQNGSVQLAAGPGPQAASGGCSARREDERRQPA